ncbi:MAG: ABC transporter permease subunit [Thermomicrobiales bacterium]
MLVMLVGIPVGLAAGSAGGTLDNVLMRFTDIVYAFPALLFFIIMQISLGETPVGKVAGTAWSSSCHALHHQLDGVATASKSVATRWP